MVCDLIAPDLDRSLNGINTPVEHRMLKPIAFNWMLSQALSHSENWILNGMTRRLE